VINRILKGIVPTDRKRTEPHGARHNAEVRCNECGALIRTVPTPDLQRTLAEMELGHSLMHY
jgi:hypothetical protein